MRPLIPGDNHNLLSNRSLGDPHPQYRQLSNDTFETITIKTSSGSITFYIGDHPYIPGTPVLLIDAPTDLPVVFREPVEIATAQATAFRIWGVLGGEKVKYDADAEYFIITGDLEVTGTITPGVAATASDGNIKYDAGDLYGYVGGKWVSLTNGGLGAGSYEPLTNGNPASPELVWDSNGDVVMVFRGS